MSYMYNNNNYGRDFGSGLGYGRQQMPQAKMTQPLTAEQIQDLRKKTGGFTLDIPEMEFVRAKCTHKENGGFTLVDNRDGTVTCTICQETFRLLDVTPEEAMEITANFVDLFQSIKTYFLDIPDVYISAIADVLPIVKQMPELYKLAQNNFSRNENGFNNLSNRGNMNGFNLLNNLLSPGGYAPQGGYQQQPQYNGGYAPQGGYGYQQPQYNGGYAPQGGYQQQPQSNGFGYNAQSTVIGNGDNHTTVAGGNGQTYTKGNSVPVKQPTTEKVFNK